MVSRPRRREPAGVTFQYLRWTEPRKARRMLQSSECLFGLIDVAAGVANRHSDSLAELSICFSPTCNPARRPASTASETAWSTVPMPISHQGNGLWPHAGAVSATPECRAIAGQQLLTQAAGNGLQVSGHALADARNLKEAGGIGRCFYEIERGLLRRPWCASIAAVPEKALRPISSRLGGLSRQPRHGGVIHCVTLEGTVNHRLVIRVETHHSYCVINGWNSGVLRLSHLAVVRAEL